MPENWLLTLHVW